MKYLMNSNVVIDYLRGSLPPSGMKFINEIVNEIPKVSIITKIEVLGFNTHPEAYKILTNFFEDALVLPLSDKIAQKTIELRRAHKIKLPDAIIAATAIEYSLTMITRNLSDFEKILEVNCLDAFVQ